MEFIKIENSDSQEFKEAWEIYESSFPSDERRTLEDYNVEYLNHC